MAKLNVRGNVMMEQLSKELDFPFQRVGSLVICLREEDMDKLQALYDRGVANGVPGLQILNREEVLEMEPNIVDNVYAALYAPSAGIVCPFGLNIAMAESACENGVEFKFDTKVQRLEKKDDIWEIHTNQGVFKTKYVVNAAGVYADKFHNMVSEKKIHITPRRGDYCLLDKTAGAHVSKSKGNVIYADDMVDLFGVDATRYFVLHEMPFENDGVITWDLVVERYNSDLANILGNLVNRTVSMSNKYFDGVVKSTGVTGEADADLKAVVTGTRDRIAKKMEKLRVADAISEVFALFRRCNKYIDETTPWVLAKDEAQQDRLAEVLYNLTESITIGASLLHSFLPETAEKIVAQLSTSLRDFDDLDKFGLYANGTKVTETPEILFARLDAKEIMPKVDAIQAKQKEEYEKEQKALNGDADTAEEGAIDIEPKDEITFDDFMKLQFQVGEILSCEAVPKSKKLLCSQVKIGSQVKQIVSGIRKDYSPEEMVGKKVMVLVNLKPAKLAGVLSEGMLLCAEDENGQLSLMTPEKPMPSGAEIA